MCETVRPLLPIEHLSKKHLKAILVGYMYVIICHIFVVILLLRGIHLYFLINKIATLFCWCKKHKFPKIFVTIQDKIVICSTFIVKFFIAKNTIRYLKKNFLCATINWQHCFRQEIIVKLLPRTAGKILHGQIKINIFS